MAAFLRRLIAGGILVLLTLGAAQAAPSFSCAGANSPLDKLICAEPSLAAADVVLASAFQDAQAGKANTALLDEQRQWLAARVAACPDIAANLPASGIVHSNAVDCLMRLYEQRVAVLRLSQNQTAWPVLPFKPKLLEGAGTKLCQALLSDITATYLGPSIIPDPLGAREIGYTTVPDPPDGSNLRRAVFDPYNGGRPVPVLWEIDDGGMHLNGTLYRRFATAAAFDHAIDALRHSNGLITDLSEPVFDADAMMDNPDSGMVKPLPSFATVDTPSEPEMPRFFRADGKVYVYSPRALPDLSGMTGVYRMVNPQFARRLCLFQADHDDDLKRYEAATKAADWSELEAAAAPLLPHGMICWAVGDAQRTRDDRALYRPWTLRQWPPMPGETAADSFTRYMRNRGLTGLEPNLHYRSYVAARDKTIAGFAQYYASAFGRDAAEARELATLWADQSLNDDAELDLDDPQTKALLTLDYPETHKAQAAALAGDETALQAALGDDAKTAAAQPRGTYDEPLPTYALEHPAVLRMLLDMGFDPDAFGASGRTALMTAARLDLVDAASLLLERGAKVDLRAGDAVAEPYAEGDALCLKAGNPPDGDTPGRTALSYAAESASPAMVRLLLGHGADRAQTDSAGSTPQSRAADRTGTDADEVRRLLTSNG